MKKFAISTKTMLEHFFMLVVEISEQSKIKVSLVGHNRSGGFLKTEPRSLTS